MPNWIESDEPDGFEPMRKLVGKHHASALNTSADKRQQRTGSTTSKRRYRKHRRRLPWR